VRRLAVTTLVVSLLGGTVAAFAVTEALKLERSPVTGPRFDSRFSPTCGCDTAVARLSVRLRTTDVVDAVIVDDEGESVRTLADDRAQEPGRTAFVWSGLDDAGRLVPDGAYRLRLHFEDSRRTILLPNEVVVDTKPPGVTLVEVTRRKLSPDGDGRRDRTWLVYSSTEKAAPLLFVDGQLEGEAEPRRAKSRILWKGRLGKRLLRAGPHLLALRVRDTAGNLSTVTDVVPVRIRYVELPRNVLRARPGAQIRVGIDTDVRRYSWVLRRLRAGGPGRVALAGTSRRKTLALRLPRSLAPGRYRLVVRDGRGHQDRAFVLVRRSRR
jgi:hypothetical protein